MSETAKMELIKADRQGRTRYSPEYRQQALDAFGRSGQSAMAFAEHLGVKYSTFASWAAKAGRSGPKQPAKPKSAGPTFLLAEIADAAPATGVSVHLPGGMVARASCHEEVFLLAELIKALA
jgi:transposase-like protein